MKRKIRAVVENHFDLTWMRCFDRDMQGYDGKNYVSYAKLEQYYIDDNLKIMESLDDYKFQIETVGVVDEYLRKFPEKKEKLKALYQAGKVKTPSAGYLIVDSNMIGEEALIRNYLLADKFYDEFIGESPKFACRSDAFGNSAQLPQILKQFGATHLREIFYTPFDDDVWVGLDGSAICVKQHAWLGKGGHWAKILPCKECNGFGEKDGKVCPVCNGRGLDEAESEQRFTPVYLAENETEDGVINVGGEECLPRIKSVQEIQKIRDEQGVDIELGFEDFILELYSGEIEKVGKGDFDGLKVRQSPEFNPCNTGVFVSRIRTKQGLNEIENRLQASETLATLEYLNGNTPTDFTEQWKKFMLCAFHDAVTGTLIDAPYVELMDWHKEINEVLYDTYLQESDGNEQWIYNPSSFERSGFYESQDGKVAFVDRLAPYSFAKVQFENAPEFVEAKAQIKKGKDESVLTDQSASGTTETADGQIFTIENEYFVIEADERGLRKITDKRYGVVSDTLGETRPNEFLLESDYGSPWTTIEKPARVMPLKGETRFVGIEKGERYTKICYSITLSMQMCDVVVVKNEQIKWSVTLFDGYDKVRFDTNVDWCTYNKRLRVQFPIPFANGEDIYGIPGGWLHREPYEPEFGRWAGANGDWPAYRWAGVETKNCSVALFNRGTPSYRILPENGGRTLAISLLRSPSIPTYLYLNKGAIKADMDGMRDEGTHTFAYELASYGNKFAETNVVKDAESFARPYVAVKAPVKGATLPYVVSGKATVSHCKVAEDKNGVIVRVVEHGGENSTAEIIVPDGVKAVYKTDMPEKKAEELSFEKTVKINLHAFEIATLRFVY